MNRFSLHETKNYDSFDFLSYNREINQSKVKSLMKSIRIHGLLDPIKVSKDKKILDGQHRFIALRTLRLPIHYVVSNNYTVQHVPEINSTQTSWKLADYAKYQADRGNVDCIDLLAEFKNWPDLSVSILATIYSKDGNRSIGTVRDGKYKFDKQSGDRLVKLLERIKDEVAENSKEQRDIYASRFIESIKHIMIRNSYFEEDRFIHALAKSRIRLYTSKADNIERNISIYNKGLKQKKKIKA